MKKAIFIVAILFIAVVSTACINNAAVQELNNSAESYMEKQDYEAAIKNLEASIELDNTTYETFYNLGVAYIESRQFAKAINALERSIELNPHNPESYYSIAVAQESLADEMSSSDIQYSKNINTKGIVKVNYDSSLSESDKELIVKNYNLSISNYNKFIEMSNSDSKKEELTSHIKGIEKVLRTIELKKTRGSDDFSSAN